MKARKEKDRARRQVKKIETSCPIVELVIRTAPLNRG